MFYKYEDGHGLPHDPLKAIVAPRPIGWISSRSKDGKVNLAPYSFFNMISTKPCLIMFCSEGHKDRRVLYRGDRTELAANLVQPQTFLLPMRNIGECTARCERVRILRTDACVDCTLINAQRVDSSLFDAGMCRDGNP